MAKKEHEKWRVRLNIKGKQVDALTPALFMMEEIRETFPNMTIYFSINNYRVVPVSLAPQPEPEPYEPKFISSLDY